MPGGAPSKMASANDNIDSPRSDSPSLGGSQNHAISGDLPSYVNRSFRPDLIEKLLTWGGRGRLSVEDLKNLNLSSKHIKDLVDSLVLLTGFKVEDVAEIPQMLQDCSAMLPTIKTLQLPQPPRESADQAFALISHNYQNLKSLSFHTDHNWGSMLAFGLVTRLTSLTSLEVSCKTKDDQEAMLSCLKHPNLLNIQSLTLSNTADFNPSAYTFGLAAAAFGALTNLQTLNLYETNFFLGDLHQVFPNNTFLPRLIKFSIRTNRLSENPDAVPDFSSSAAPFPNLREVVVGNVKSQEMLDAVTSAVWFLQLQSLTLGLSEGLNISQVSNAAQLKTFTVFWPWDPPIFTGLELPQLTELRINGGKGCLEADGELVDVSIFPNLEKCLCDCYGYKLSRFVDIYSPPPILKTLDIRKAKLNKEEVRTVSSLWVPKCQELSLLRLNKHNLIELLTPLEPPKRSRNAAAASSWPLLRKLMIEADYSVDYSVMLDFFAKLTRVAAQIPCLRRFEIKFNGDLEEELEEVIDQVDASSLWPYMEELIFKSGNTTIVRTY